MTIFTILLSFSIFIFDNYAEVVQRIISETGQDNEDCLKCIVPCATFEYALNTDQIDELEITIDHGTHKIMQQITVEALTSLLIESDSFVDTILSTEEISLPVIFELKNIDQIKLTGFTIKSKGAQAFAIDHSQSVSLTDVYYEIFGDCEIWPSSLYSLVSVDETAISFTTKNDWIGLDQPFSSYLYDFENCENILVTNEEKVSFSTGCRFIRSSGQSTLLVDGFSFTGSSGNMILLEDCPSLTLDNSHFSFNSNYEQKPNRGNPESTATISFSRGETLTISRTIFESFSLGAIEVHEADEITLEKCTFQRTKIDPFFIPSCYSGARINFEELFGGFGCCLTCRDIVTSVEIKDCQFSQVGYTDTDISIVDFADFSSGLHAPNPKFVRSDVFSLIYIQNAASLGLTNNVFSNHMLVPEVPKSHFLSTKAGIPTQIQLKHTTRSRAGTLIFAENVETIESVNDAADTVIGSFLATVDCDIILVEGATVKDVRPTSSDFSHACIFSSSDLDNHPESGFEISSSTFQNVGPRNLGVYAMTRPTNSHDGLRKPQHAPPEASSGGVVHIASCAEVSLGDLTFDSCLSGADGGCVFIGDVGEALVDGVKCTNCKALGGGGSCFSRSQILMVRNGIASNCSASQGGYIAHVNPLIDIRSEVINNTVTDSHAGIGGAFDLRITNTEDDTDAQSIDSNTITGCSAMFGGGVSLRAPTNIVQISLDNNTFDTNTAIVSGAAVNIILTRVSQRIYETEFVCTNTTFSGNIVGMGGIVFINSFKETSSPSSFTNAADFPMKFSGSKFTLNSYISGEEDGKAIGCLSVRESSSGDHGAVVVSIDKSSFLDNKLAAMSGLYGSTIHATSTEFRNNSVSIEGVRIPTQIVCRHARITVDSQSKFHDGGEQQSICDDFCSLHDDTSFKCPKILIKSAKLSAKVTNFPNIPPFTVLMENIRPTQPHFFLSTLKDAVPHRTEPLDFLHVNSSEIVNSSILVKANILNDKGTIAGLASTESIVLPGLNSSDNVPVFLWVTVDGTQWSIGVQLVKKSVSASLVLAISLPVVGSLVVVILVVVIVCLCCRKKTSRRTSYTEINSEVDPLLRSSGESRIFFHTGFDN